MTRLRHPIVVVLGHVDHGKTSLLDRMRGTIVAAREAGGITQHIGASIFPLEAIVETCKQLLGEVKARLEIPGLLFIDTPGHAAFSNLRRRGGSIADMAILVIDVMKGVQEQTRESIQLLKARRTPFIVAANKIDMIPGWRPVEGASFREAFEKQSRAVQEDLEARIYQLIGDLSFFGFRADLYTRISNFTTTLAIVPVSAKTGEGVAELLLLILGLAQQFMKSQIEYHEGPGQGVIFELVEEEGLGITANVILHDGVVRVGDRLAYLSKSGPTVTKVRALLLPKPLDEMRDPRDRFKNVEEVKAAAGVKVVAEGFEDAVPGSPVQVVMGGDEKTALDRISEELGEFVVSTDKVGVVLKADTLGSLEAAFNYLKERGVSVRMADIGDVSKKDIVEAEVVRRKDDLKGVILAFNVYVDEDLEKDANSRGVRIFKGDVLFRLVEDYLNWVEEQVRMRTAAEFGSLVKPGKIKVLKGYVFRRSNPAIVGVEVVAGVVKPGYKLVNKAGRVVGTIAQIQDRGIALPEAEKGKQVAVSVREATVGRTIHEEEELYVAIPERDARQLIQNYLHMLDQDAAKTLSELVEIMRKSNPLWAR
ncbi:MAG TPA: translation initiation factor IF-2 [Candidatus Caldiarchaeum subterraneum]|uniref:Probable translation initiation factor IF-2 n=1 Tax=Caldiarchaeum subterraneum TaxID=311458 RepID=A0A833A2H9_CALS0|nr:translation initiation factor IF-2 [Candidatus Caldarchaeum subterraneum]